MACQTIPTSTLFSTTVITSFSVKSELETTTITSPAQTSTTSTPVCASSATITLSDSVATTCASTSMSTFETTIPGETDTQTITHTSTVPITSISSVPTSTLYSTSCPPDDSTPPPTPPSTPTPTPTPTPPPDDRPPPTSTSDHHDDLGTTTITSGITLPNGQTSFTVIVITTQPPQLNDPNGSGGDGGGAARAAKIGGAVVGSIVGAALLVGLAVWFWKRSRRWDDIFEDSDDEAGAFDAHPGWKIVGAPVRLRNRSRRARKPRLDLDPPAPAPYHYGLVGSTTAMNAPAHAQTPSSPPESPLGAIVRPASSTTHTRVPSELTLPPGVLGTPLFTSDPFAAQPVHPMSARGGSPSPRVSLGSSNTLEMSAAANASASVQFDPNRSPMKAPVPPQQQTSPVIVHQDAGPAPAAQTPPAYRD